MRILDKYLLREFGWPLLYCFDAFGLLWLVMDLFDNLSDFLRGHATFVQVVRYYLVVFPNAFVLILPWSLLLGLLFCLTNLGKHNEIIAMRAGGVSVLRLAVPLLGVAVAGSLLMFAVNELFVPRSKERAHAIMRSMQRQGPAFTVENFFFTDPVERRDWYARLFNTRTYNMDELVTIVGRNPDGTEMRIDAERARWFRDAWHFYDVRINGGTLIPETNFPAIKTSPKRLAVEGKRPDEMTSTELRRYIRSQRRAGHTNRLAGHEVVLHYRYALPWTCLIVVWLGIPLGMRVSRSGPLLGVGTALLLVVSFYFVTQLALALGRGDRIGAPLSAWLTNIIFAIVGAVLLLRAR